MEPYEPHLAIATALAVGFLIGLEREQAHPEGQGSAFAGVRTYPILALVGALATMLEGASMWLPLVPLLGVIALLALSYAAHLKQGHNHGATTEIAALATYLLGALAASRGVVEPMTTRFLLVAIIGVVLTFLLSSKQMLHGIASRVSRDDFYATVKFLIVAVVVVPLLPRHEVGPLHAIEPFDVGLMVVIIAGLSFIGYVAVHWLGTDRGLLVSAAFGGLVSSTGVTLSFARRAKQEPALVPVAAGAIAIASVIMLLRIGVLVAIVHVSLLPRLALPLGAAAVGAVIVGLIVYQRQPMGDQPIAVKNPFELGAAIQFGVVFALILLATKAAKVYLGTNGLYAAAAIAGTTDVDAITLSTAKLGGISANVAMIGILLAAATNTIVKSIFALALGNRALGVRAFAIGGAILVAGGAGLAASLAIF